MGKMTLIGLCIVILLALAGTGDAFKSGQSGYDCYRCHASQWTSSNIAFYNQTHRYNDTVQNPPSCENCHAGAWSSSDRFNFSLRAGTPTYLNSATCNRCHKAKYDNWSNTLHRVMLTEKTKAQAMGLPEPEVGWAGISYVIVTKFEFNYINTTGYFLSQKDVYETVTKEFVTSSHAGGRYGTCARCHTTGYNATGVGGLPGITGTFSEPGIACERCHDPAGNGHQVVINYSGNFCIECHTGTLHGTDWENSRHAPPPYTVGSECVLCHSPFDKYKNENVTKNNATGVSCGVCHNIHNMTDDKYAQTFSGGIFNNNTWAEVSNAKLSFFNATASISAGTDIFDILVSPALLYPGDDFSRKDPSYGNSPINVSGPVSEVLCSKCHYRHGLAHVSGINLTHSRMNYPQNEWATCTDCHMAGINASVGKDLMKKHSNYPLKDVSQSCGGTTKCHITSDQNLNRSSYSIVPIFNEWNKSLHNDRINGGFFENGTNDRERASSCSKCHSPVNWNPANGSALVGVDVFRGITCQVCHNIHDMGDWLKKTKAVYGVAKPYAWYDRDSIVEATDAQGVPTRYKASYTMMANTTELCGNCHANIREGRTAPGWASATAANPISPHGFPAKDIFVGSVKQKAPFNFECKDCHMAKRITDPTNLTEMVLPDDQKVTGHSFRVNISLLQSNVTCAVCHITGSEPGNISSTINKIRSGTLEKWNVTNITVMNALATINAFTGPKDQSRDLIAKAYWNLRLVSSDGSWGVHDPVKINDLLNDSAKFANDALVALGATGAPSIISLLPASEGVKNIAGENRTFMAVTDREANISWQINGFEVLNQTNVTVSTYINTSAARGTWNVTAIASNAAGADKQMWEWAVKPIITKIEIKNFTFNPANVTVLKGTAINWTNNDSEIHTVTSDTTIFDSGNLNTGQTFERFFNEVGTFNYHCALHPGMVGVVNVISKPIPTPPEIEETGIALLQIADNLTAPIGLVSAEDGTGRLFIVDQTGIIKILNASGVLLQEPFLDLGSRLVNLRTQFDERGLLGLAFHPNFKQNGRFFVYYSTPLRQGAPANFDHTSTISEFRISNDLNRANQSSEKILLQVDEPQFNHNAGQIAFGPDGYLYIPLGDGGGGNDVGIGHPPPGNGQNISTYLGKILRIDVNSGNPYGIPPDNPFVGKNGLDEIFAYGFRNPFRISFDAGGEHSLFAADAGQRAWEEVDIVKKGGNYGWNIREGAHCFDPNVPDLDSGSCPDNDTSGQPLIDPVIEYANGAQPGGIGTTVIGGFVYRGKELPQFNGSYIFGDFSKGFVQGNGSLFIARPPQSSGKWSIKELRVSSSNNGRTGGFVRSFGQDEDHEIYVLTSQTLGPTNNTGKIFKIKPFNVTRNFQATLSGNAVVSQQPIGTSAKGNATFELSNDSTKLYYRITLENITNVTQAHIHLAPAGVNGPVVVWLYPGVPPNPILIPGRFDGLLAEGNITSVNLTGPLAGQPMSALLEAMIGEGTYVNVHTLQVPAGEIRGQIRSSGALQPVFNVSGYKVNDLNSNGLSDTGEPGLENWKIGLNCPNCGSEIANTSTNKTGFYQFTNLRNGSYIVTEEPQSGWINTSNASRTITINGGDIVNLNFTNMNVVTPVIVTSFELKPDMNTVPKGENVTLIVKAMNNSLSQAQYEGEANITIKAVNTSAVNARRNLSFVNGSATFQVSSSIAQFVNITATNGTLTGSTTIEFADLVIPLAKGWNLISIPSFARPSDISQALQLVQNNGVQTFNPGTGMFITPTDLVPLYAYWINVTADDQKLGFIADTSVVILPPTRTLSEGWNLIGVSASKIDAQHEMTPRKVFVDLRNGDLPSQWMYSRLVSFDEVTGRFTTYTADEDLTLELPHLKQGHGYWLFIKGLPNTNKNNLPWAGKLW